MMNTQQKKLVGSFATAALLVGSTATAAAATLSDAPAKEAAPAYGVEQESGLSKAGFSQVSNVQGTFSFDQSTISSNDYIASVFRTAAAAVCASLPDYDVSTEAGAIDVGGSAAGNAFSATVDDMADSKDAKSYVIGCSCASNTAGGGAIANAEVSGVSLETVTEMAGVR